MEAPKQFYHDEEEDHEEGELTDFSLEKAIENARFMAHWQGQLEEVVAAHKAEVEKLDSWLSREEERILKRTNWHLSMLKQHMAKADKKTLRTPYGTAKVIAGRERIEVEDRFVDDIRNIGWVNQKVTKVPDKKAIMDHIKTIGEIPTGVTLVRGEDSVTFKVSK